MWKFQQIKPADARGRLKKEYWDDPRVRAEEKLDGHRAVAQFCVNATRFTSRRISVKTGKLVENSENLPHLVTRVVDLIGTVLDGELVVPGNSDSMKVTSILGSGPERALELQECYGYLNYVVFDCLFFQGADLRERPLRDRRKYLREALGIWESCIGKIDPETHVRAVRSTRTNKRKFCDKIMSVGGEGVILKDLDKPYHQRYWAKVKREATYDVIVTGYEDAKEISEKVDGTVSETKYKGMVGAIKFGQFVIQKQGHRKFIEVRGFGQTSGFSDKLRKELTKNGEKYVGQVMEIKAQYRIKKTGKFRHPQFKRWRPDKNPKDCRYDPNES